MKYWIFLHHKCASQYLRAQVSSAGQHSKRLTEIPSLNSFKGPPDTEAMAYAMTRSDYCLDDNAWPESVNILDAQPEHDWRAIHFVRDPRDLLVSAYFSHKHSHSLHSLPGLRAHREALCAMPIETGLMADMNYSVTAQAIESILDWPEHPKVKTFNAISLGQEMARGDLAMFEYVCDWIDIPLEPDWTMPPTWDAVSEGRPKQEELNTHHYRHGVEGDWKRYFTTEVMDEFHRRFPAFSRRFGAAV